MPVPKPHKNETQNDFIDRCMSDPNMQEYSQDQRLGVCFTQWHDRNKAMAQPMAPLPDSGETETEFMDRCMNDPGMMDVPADERASMCSVAWDNGNKSFRAATPDFKCSPTTNLPIKDGVAFDRSVAIKSMLDAAGIGTDNPDVAKARRGFLIHDAANPNLRGSYHLPFATMVDGELTAIGNGIRNAGSRLPQMDGVPDSVRAEARKVLDGYMQRLHEMNSQNSAPTPLTRAYSVIEIKSFNEEERIIEGIATTPATDRYNDIVEPLGAAFSLPMPLLWQHNQDQPVGLVETANPTRNGIPFRAKLPKIAEPGILKDRIDEAWQSVKAGLVRGVSIGFKPLSYEVIKDAEDRISGLRYTSWDWMELSLVTIPANAEATINSIRSYDSASLRTATGSKGGVVSIKGSLGASGKPAKTGSSASPSSSTSKPIVRKTEMPKPVNEQIAEFVAVRGEKAARMAAIMEAAGEKGETLDAAQQEEFDTIEREVETIDQHLNRLRTLEKLHVATARPVQGNSSDTGSSSRASVPASVAVPKKLAPGIEFTRYAMCLMTARGNPDTALRIAEARFPDEQRIQNVLRAAVAAGTTTDPTWAGALTQYVDFAGDFIDFLRPATIIGKFGQNGIPALRTIPFNVRVKRQTSGGDAYWVGEGQPKPLTAFDFDTVLLRWAKIANIAVLTDEQVRFSTPSAEVAVRAALSEAIAAREDITFIDPTVTAIADTRPASITNGATSHVSSGTDAAAARADAGTLMTAFATANLPYSQAVWIMNSTAAIQLFLMRNTLGQPEFPGMLADGGTFMGRPVIVSDHIGLTGSPASGIIVLMIPQEIYLSDDGQVVVDASREASLQMDDAPTMASTSGSPAAPTATSVVSMFQTNSIAIRAERYINWVRRRDAAVQYLTGVRYAA